MTQMRGLQCSLQATLVLWLFSAVIQTNDNQTSVEDRMKETETTSETSLLQPKNELQSKEMLKSPDTMTPGKKYTNPLANPSFQHSSYKSTADNVQKSTKLDVADQKTTNGKLQVQSLAQMFEKRSNQDLTQESSQKDTDGTTQILKSSNPDLAKAQQPQEPQKSKKSNPNLYNAYSNKTSNPDLVKGAEGEGEGVAQKEQWENVMKNIQTQFQTRVMLSNEKQEVAHEAVGEYEEDANNPSEEEKTPQKVLDHIIAVSW
jgi:hypothetical protein